MRCRARASPYNPGVLTLINANLMRPAIAPIGLDYVAGAARAAGIETRIVDLCLEGDPDGALRSHFQRHAPALVGISVRNVDDSFWPSMQSFLPALKQLLRTLRLLTGAPVVLGGAGFSTLASRILAWTGADYGIRGDGEAALVALYRGIEGRGNLQDIPGLLSSAFCNPPAWSNGDSGLRISTRRDAIDNAVYFRLGGQLGLETKRGCPAECDFCADTLAKGSAARLRPPADVAEEAVSLLRQGVDVLHLCDGEFNLPHQHARAVCDEFIRRGLGSRLRWYTYMAVTPFDADLARAMRRAGCLGINFTGPAATDTMLRAYGQHHRRSDLARCVREARASGITVMVDMMFGGPGETPQTVREAIEFLKQSGPDCVGAALGVRLYPGLPLTSRIEAEGPLDSHPGVRRRYGGPVDLLWPTYYVAPALGERPAAVIRDAIAGDGRFFEPADEPETKPDAGEANAKGYNYNANTRLVRAIAAGARGAYWDILRTLAKDEAAKPKGTGARDTRH